MPPPLIQLTTIQELLTWYEINLCNKRLEDPRRFRVRFKVNSFVHLIQMKTRFGAEPRNKRMTIEQIKTGRIHFVKGRFDEQRASELSWASELATRPDRIVRNWQPMGRGQEVYIKNFGTEEYPKYRALVCLVTGTTREGWTIFPREKIGETEFRNQVWP